MQDMYKISTSVSAPPKAVSLSAPWCFSSASWNRISADSVTASRCAMAWLYLGVCPQVNGPPATRCIPTTSTPFAWRKSGPGTTKSIPKTQSVEISQWYQQKLSQHTTTRYQLWQAAGGPRPPRLSRDVPPWDDAVRGWKPFICCQLQQWSHHRQQMCFHEDRQKNHRKPNCDKLI